MPYVRISLLKGKPPAFLEALSDSIHRALVDAFDVPEADRFHLIHQCEQNELIFDRHYLCGPRSDDYLLIHITAGRPRSDQMKARLYRRLASLLGASPGVRASDVMVVLDTTAMVDWSFGDGIAAAALVPRSREAT